MKSRKVLRMTLAGTLVLLALALALLALLAFVPIKLDLTSQRSMVESTASALLGRSVRVGGNLSISTSLWPAIELGDIRIGNPEGFSDGDLLVMKQAKLYLGVLPLLRGKLHIDGLSVHGLDVRLLEDGKGDVNWVFNAPRKNATSRPGNDQNGNTGGYKLTSDSLVIQDLKLADISVSYRSGEQEQPIKFHLGESIGSALPGQPLSLTMQGTLDQHEFSGELKLGSLKELIEKNRSWADIRIDIAETHIGLSGNLDILPDAPLLKLKVSVEGKRLDSLNRLLALDLPPLNAYQLKAVLSTREKQLDLSELDIRVGKSSLIGSMKTDTSQKSTNIDIALTAPLIQLEDFNVGDWSPETGTETPPDSQKSNSGDKELRELISSRLLEKLRITLDLSIQRVLSGKDELGSGHLKGRLRDGRIEIAPLTLNLPGGSFDLALSLKPGKTAAEAKIQAKVVNFDLGVPARIAHPESDFGGVVNLDISLTSTAGRLSDLFREASGHLDFSSHPVNLRAGVLDLWAINLLASIAAKGAKDESQVNCMVGRLKMEEGILTPEAFVIDTSNIRICGSGQADFKQETFDFSVAPTPKRPQFFSLATPFRALGNFTDFEMGISTDGIIGTTLNWVTSPLHVPLRTLAGEKLPADGDDVCNIPLGPSNRPTSPLPGCRIHENPPQASRTPDSWDP
ncbi:MAG: AsmA family protein [Gammaproteobacteria bacterium]|nr:AsmA family protein [Gammaproteobacteria bacterium]